MRLREYFVGIPKDRKQFFIGGIVQYLVIKKIANQLLPMERCQIDLVFEKKPTKDENENIYKYVLSCLDVFSRYIFLERSKSKDTIEEANQIKEILVLEFPGILLLIYRLHLLTGQ